MSDNQPTYYSQQEHGIDQNLIDKDALYVIQKLQANGYSAYLVGGGVRDLLRSVPPKDFDVSTSAKPEEIKKLFGRKCLLIGRRFRLAHIRFGKKVIEVSTFRALDEAGEGELILNDNEFGSAVEDALRRDFTINGLFYNPENQEVIDYVGGFQDLKEKKLCCIGDPLVRFKEDPVRMIRLIKFESRLGFSVDPLMMEALESLRQEITKSAQARILEEMLRMLESGFGASFFRRIHTLGLLEPIFPPLAALLDETIQEKVFSYLEAADKILARFGKKALERPVLTSCLIYPILEKKISAIGQEKTPHLGDITVMAHDLIRDIVTASFSRFPKRLSALMSSIMINQYRLTPHSNRKFNRKKFLESQDFLPSLKFLKIRSLVEPELVAVYSHWNTRFREEVDHSDHKPHPHHYHHPRSKRRRQPKRRV